MNKYIRRHIIWEYWIVVIFGALSIGLSTVFIVYPNSILTVGQNPISIHANTVFLVLVFFWLRFLKKKLNEEGT